MKFVFLTETVKIQEYNSTELIFKTENEHFKKTRFK